MLQLLSTALRSDQRLFQEPPAVSRFMMVLRLLWVRFMVPETKGVPLEELSRKPGLEESA
jgi:hypothetical protein